MASLTRWIGTAAAVLGLMAGTAGEADAGIIYGYHYQVSPGEGGPGGDVYFHLDSSDLSMPFSTGGVGVSYSATEGFSIAFNFRSTIWLPPFGFADRRTEILLRDTTGTVFTSGDFFTKGLDQLLAEGRFDETSYWWFEKGSGDHHGTEVSVTVIPSPEPSTLATAGLGLLMGLGYAWRRRRPA